MLLTRKQLNLAKNVLNLLIGGDLEAKEALNKYGVVIDDILHSTDELKDSKVPEVIRVSNAIRAYYTEFGTMFIAMTIFKLSQQYVPVDTGNLRDSAKIIPLDNGGCRIVYETPYAAVQHEDVDFTHIEPGRAKYLEDAAYEVLNYSGDFGGPPLFTFKIVFPGDGAVGLDIDTIDVDEFLKNKRIYDRLQNLTWEGLDELDSYRN